VLLIELTRIDDVAIINSVLPYYEPLKKEIMSHTENYNWKNQEAIVDSSLSQKAIENIEKVDTEMLRHMDNLQDLVQRDLYKHQPVIVAQFTPGGGKYTLLRNEYGNESRVTVEPVPKLFALAKSIAHAPLGIYACFEPYSTDPKNHGWRKALKSYCKVLKVALRTFDNVKEGFQIDEALKSQLVQTLNGISGDFEKGDPCVKEATVVAYIHNVLKQLLASAINFIDIDALTLTSSESPMKIFQEWCNATSGQEDNAHDTVYKLIVQCQIISATTQQYGISRLMKKWKASFDSREWKKLYVIVEAEWVTRKLNSIAQCILPEMADKELALDQHLLIVTNLSGVEPALHFLARILEDRAAADLILTDHSEPRDNLSGQTDLLGPVMRQVVCSSVQVNAQQSSLKNGCPVHSTSQEMPVV